MAHGGIVDPSPSMTTQDSANGAGGVPVAQEAREALDGALSSRTPRPIVNCPTCITRGKQGSCARNRCYCGHQECWAFDSYYDARASATRTVVRAADKRMAQSWAERDEPTWLDR